MLHTIITRCSCSFRTTSSLSFQILILLQTFLPHHFFWTTSGHCVRVPTIYPNSNESLQRRLVQDWVGEWRGSEGRGKAAPSAQRPSSSWERSWTKRSTNSDKQQDNRQRLYWMLGWMQNTNTGGRSRDLTDETQTSTSVQIFYNPLNWTHKPNKTEQSFLKVEEGR